MRTQTRLSELEAQAHRLLAAGEHTGGPLSQRSASDLAAHLAILAALRGRPAQLHAVGERPGTTASTSRSTRRRLRAPRLLQALAGHVPRAKQPEDYRDFLLQRVETNYLAAALMVPEDDAVAFLTEAKDKRELSVEDLRDAFAVSYETAAHRFTNLATQHLGIPVHFLKVHESGTISKAYENDNAAFPTDVLRGGGQTGVPANGAPAACSTPRTGSARSTSTPTSRTAPTGAPPASSPPRRARSR